MIDLCPATEDEMVLAFLKAELNSPRFSSEYQIDRRTLVDSADLGSPSQNAARLNELRRVKGALFPPNVAWRRVALENGDLLRLKYANLDNWRRLSRHTRLVSDGAKNVHSMPDNPKLHILAVAKEFQRGATYPELIAVAGEEEGAGIILIEGHVRATAYAVAGWPGRTDCILGTSSSAEQWDHGYGCTH